MNYFQRFSELITGLLMILSVIILIADPWTGYVIVVLILSLGFIGRGARLLFYYFTMSRFMVGGRVSLFEGAILLDLGLFTLSLTDLPLRYVLFYFVVIYMFEGIVLILRAMEAKRYGAGTWKLKLAHGIVDFLMAISCIVFTGHIRIVALILSVGIVYSAILRIITAFRKTAMVYIQ